MAFSSTLTDRVRSVFLRLGVEPAETRMMGGLCFMVNAKMCVGVYRDSLMVRMDPEKYSWALEQVGCRPMDITGRPMSGFVWVDPDGHDLQEQLEYWIELALEYNPRAMSSKKKKKKSGARDDSANRL